MRPGDTVVIDGGEINLSLQIDEGEIGKSVPVYENNYNNLRNRPAINGVTLEGDLSSEDLGIDAGVTSVNGQTGDVTLDASDVGALPVNTPIPEKTSDLQNDSGYVNQTQAANAAPVQSVNGQTGDVSLDASDVGALPDDTPIPEKTSELQNDSGFITGIDSSDVTEALGYTPYDAANPAGYLNEVTSQDVTEALGFTPYNATNPNGYVNQTQAANAAPVQNVNGKTGNVSLEASDVGALPDDTFIPTKTSDLTNDSGFITSAPVASVNGQTGAVVLDADDVGALPDSTVIPTKTSELTNDSGYLTSETDPTVPSWAKQANPPTYALSYDENSVGSALVGDAVTIEPNYIPSGDVVMDYSIVGSKLYINGFRFIGSGVKFVIEEQ